MGTTQIKHWQALTVRDAELMTRWLAAVGFREHATYRNPSDPRVIDHAEWVWSGGGIMFGTARDDSPVAGPGTSSAYLVVADPDELAERAAAAGGEIVQPVEDKGYGGRGGTVRDPEGNHWSFGTYQPG